MLASTTTSPPEIRLLREGELWQPYNYGAVRNGERVGRRRFARRPGYAVLGAFVDGELVGCAEVSVCDQDVLRQSEEYGGGDLRNGPFFHEHTEQDGRFLLIHSLWVHPRDRMAGIADALCRHLAKARLPTYALFARDWVCVWFARSYAPDAYRTVHRARRAALA
jgi:ribosomal protein S18 acetylase RimI-like enzyme